MNRQDSMNPCFLCKISRLNQKFFLLFFGHQSDVRDPDGKTSMCKLEFWKYLNFKILHPTT